MTVLSRKAGKKTPPGQPARSSRFVNRTDLTRSSGRRRLLICEEALKGHTGHWYEYDKAVTAINREAGHDVAVLAHRDVETTVAQELDASPFYQFTNWDGIYNHPQAWKRYVGILRHNWRVYRATDRYLSQTEAYDCVFVPTVIVYHLLAWLALARKHGGKNAKRIVLLIRNSAATYSGASSDPVFKRSTKLLAWVLRQYRPLIDKGVVCLATDSHRLAREYKLLADIDLVVFPHPRSGQVFAQSNQSIDRKPKIVMSSLGPARWEKGAHVLVRAIEILASRSDVPPIHFVIQWNHEIITPDGTSLEPKLQGLADSPISCEIIGESLSSSEYNSRLQESDCILLPYLRQAYYARISGVAVEAMLLGIPMIYTDDTWVADVAQEYGTGLATENESAEDLANKIYRLATTHEQLQQVAQQRAPLAQKHFSARHLYDCLWNQSLPSDN